MLQLHPQQEPQINVTGKDISCVYPGIERDRRFSFTAVRPDPSHCRAYSGLTPVKNVRRRSTSPFRPFQNLSPTAFVLFSSISQIYFTPEKNRYQCRKCRCAAYEDAPCHPVACVRRAAFRLCLFFISAKCVI